MVGSAAAPHVAAWGHSSAPAPTANTIDSAPARRIHRHDRRVPLMDVPPRASGPPTPAPTIPPPPHPALSPSGGEGFETREVSKRSLSLGEGEGRGEGCVRSGGGGR